MPHSPEDYHEVSTVTLPTFLAGHEDASDVMEALGATDASEIEAVEMGDGNLNLVFIVSNKNNPDKKVIVKQALPYVRCVGESWPMTLERAYFEYKALTAFKKACANHVPKVYYFSRINALMAMQYIPPPNIILRKGLIQKIRYPTMASDIGVFCGKTLFQGSGFKLQPKQLREQVEFWSKNSEMCALTEQVIFTEPYIEASNNRWTSPQLDDDKKELENDQTLRLAVAKLKNKFVTETQTLLHGDIHTGSVMCSPEPSQTFVIDPEFAFYGPLAFDTGFFIANLLLNYVSQPGHANDGDDDDTYSDWILEQVKVFWQAFAATFVVQWNDVSQHTGYRYQRTMFPSTNDHKVAQKEWMANTLSDSVAFAGCEMIRRIVGIAHVEDLDSIADADVRAKCERHGLEIAKVLIKEQGRFSKIEEVIEVAKGCQL
ncbi:hypothetical protein MPSEU_000446000 [Mayamaea pseudoterrestris]|nr:hypothetical protein MPSEU_000446000 [Mayamaea pseudoterrestris]